MKNKNHVATKTVKKLMTGIRVEWECITEKDGDIFDAKVTHKNKMIAITGGASKIFRDLYDTINTVVTMRWLVTVNVIFDYPNGQRQTETREIEAHCFFNQLTSFVNEQLEDAKRHGDINCYAKTVYSVECLG